MADETFKYDSALWLQTCLSNWFPLISGFTSSADCPACQSEEEGKLLSSETVVQKVTLSNIAWPDNTMMATEGDKNSTQPIKEESFFAFYKSYKTPLNS